MNRPNTFVLLLLVILIGCQKPGEPVDLLVTNAHIWTANHNQRFAEAMAIRNGKIISIGSNEEVNKAVGKATRTVDAEGRMITPGFIDTHVHFLSSSYKLTQVQLRDASTPEEFIRRIAVQAEKQEDGEWILGGDWDHTLWGGELPKAEWIDSVTLKNPVAVGRLDGHMILANSLAMQMAGVNKETPDVPGGAITRDAEGNPEGVFKDLAEGLIRKVIDNATDEQNDRAFIEGMKHVASKGVTTVHNMDQYDTDVIRRYKRIAGEEIIRFYVAVELSYWKDLKEYLDTNGTGDEWLKIGVLKGMVDGSLGSHTAAFKEPYTDLPSDSGFFLLPEQVLKQRIISADSAGLHLAVHAIGDRAISVLLDAFDEAIKKNGSRDRRLRIEHAQHLDPADFVRFNELNVIASMQPYHAIDDGRWASEVIGQERSKSTYAFKSFLDQGVMLAFGSDWSVAPATPLEGIYAAVTRQTLDGANADGWIPEQKISVEDALKAYTINGAYASFDEDLKGSLEVGKLADFVILERNILEIAPNEIKDVKVDMTFVNGNQVFSRME